MTAQDPHRAALGAGPAPVPAGRKDLREGLGWALLGLVILILSLNMDRLEEQGVAPFAAPGLLPGLLGIGMLLFGGVLVLRGWHARGAATAAAGGEAQGQLRPGRLALVLGLCLTFSIVLIGHGLPFWLASAIFVTVSILVLQHPQRQAAGRGLDARSVVIALVIGVCAGLAVTTVFQNFFLVHLP